MKNIILAFAMLITLQATAQKNITLEHIYKDRLFTADAVSGFKSMKDGNFYTEITDNKLVKINFATGKVAETLIDFKVLNTENNKLDVDAYEMDATETKVLLYANGKSIYRRSIAYNVYVYDLIKKTLLKPSATKVLHASFNAAATIIAYIKSNNLYMYNLLTESESQITNDGVENKIINGNCDWVYEEEFGFTKAYQWAPVGNHLVYYKFDESKVKEFNFAQYDNLYPTDVRYKYPKAGEDNSNISLYWFDAITKQNVKLDIGEANDIYIPRINWMPNGENILVSKLNRLQNYFQIFATNPAINAKLCYQEKNKYYVSIDDNVACLKDNNTLILTSEKDGFKHLYSHNIAKQITTPITKGNWEVLEIKGIDEATKTIYYMGNKLSPLEKNLYAIKLDGTKEILITKNRGVHSIDFSSGFNYYLDAYSKLNQPTIFSIKNKKDELVRDLKTNENIKARMQEFGAQPYELINVPNGLGDTLNGWILKPSNINDGKKHPLLMFQYSGPGSQQVTNSFMARDYWWYQMLAQKGYVIACIDGRGTGARGEAFKKCTYKQLGNVESDDQIAAAKFLGTLNYIDANRIGIWGWSYGGYMSSICICKGADVFKSAIAVAPVTNWRYYDNIYTERYMQRPQDNAAGYDNNSPVNMVKNLKGNYLLIHGSADDNVHYQNTMEMIAALIKADKPFDSEVYPNTAHGISGGNNRYHLYKRLTKFIEEKL